MATTGNISLNREDNPRKRLRFSRDDPRGEQAVNALQTPATMSTHTSQEIGLVTTKSSLVSCQHEAALKTLQHDIDTMRHLLTCQICHRFMYEPYALSCGHTYCYSCLSQWLGDNRKKTCPDCRTEIYQQPTPSYVIRELVLVFVSRDQLLPDGETSEEHKKLAKDEADIVSKDKANMDVKKGGLFRGTFKRNRALAALHDPSDNVERCPICHWEVEDGYCNNCGESDSGENFSDLEDDLRESDANLDELDEALTENDHDGFDDHHDDFENDDNEELSDSGGEDIDPAVFSAAFGNGPVQGGRSHRHRRREQRPIDISFESEDESEDEEDEADSDLRDFVEDDELLTDDDSHAATYDSDDTAVQQMTSRPRYRRGAPVIISDEEDATGFDSLNSIDGSDNEGSIAPANQRSKRPRIAHRRRLIAISSDSEASEEETDGGESRRPSVGGFCSPQQGSEVIDNGTEDDDDDRSTNFGDSEIPNNTNFLQYSYPSGMDDSSISESESDSDENSDNGWGPNIPSAFCIEFMLISVTGPDHVRNQSTTINPSPIIRETGLHSRRYDAAPAYPSSARLPRMSRGMTYHVSTLHHYNPPFSPLAASHPPIYAAHRPLHFANTLDNVSIRKLAQRPLPRSRNNDRGSSALSNQSSIGGGGVHIRSCFSASASSRDSSRTIGPSNNGRGKNPERPGKTAVHG